MEKNKKNLEVRESVTFSKPNNQKSKNLILASQAVRNFSSGKPWMPEE